MLTPEVATARQCKVPPLMGESLQVGIESTIGRGALFFFTLPAVDSRSNLP